MAETPLPEDSTVDSVPVRPGTCPTSALLARAVRSSDLFGGAKMVLIEHGGEQYRLIVTKNDKLILQK